LVGVRGSSRTPFLF